MNPAQVLSFRDLVRMNAGYLRYQLSRPTQAAVRLRPVAATLRLTANGLQSAGTYLFDRGEQLERLADRLAPIPVPSKTLAESPHEGESRLTVA